MDDLFEKQVLVIAPEFFGYEQEIVREMLRRGAKVDLIADRPFSSPLMKAVMRLRNEWVLPFADRFFMKAIEAFDRVTYDLIFVIVGEGLSVHTLSLLRAAFPRANFVLYMWDALRSKPSIQRNLSYFDACYTFDADDAKSFSMMFRPLFFSPGFRHKALTDFAYHLSFVGTAHSDRYKIISAVTAALPKDANYYWYLYLQARWVFLFQRIFNPAYRGTSIKKFYFDPLKKADVQRIFFDSLAVLDIEHPYQTGLTMRTFEALGARKKLITTNALVRDMDFFDPANILVLDRHNIQKIPDLFLKTPYKDIPNALYEKYSLSGWLREILAGIKK